jgi:hypothetical protein
MRTSIRRFQASGARLRHTGPISTIWRGESAEATDRDVFLLGHNPLIRWLVGVSSRHKTS